jgi:hypothetical protein
MSIAASNANKVHDNYPSVTDCFFKKKKKGRNQERKNERKKERKKER